MKLFLLDKRYGKVIRVPIIIDNKKEKLSSSLILNKWKKIKNQYLPK